MAGRGKGRGRKWAAPPADMASMSVALGNVATPANKQIPLFCTVCPDTPRFSDVSHLLTHIASKGHLHHETQTKLKAHQDISAAMALQQYEQWYRQNEIETLLVERLKAKQVKEAARGRRSYVPLVNSAPRLQNKRKSTASTIDDFIKMEDGHDYPDFPILPSLFPMDLDPDITIDYVTGPDMMALKGQVWPGMGKMDLANDEMKRTRNQRKPKSVIERMRRASEGIESTEVIMSNEFEVERTRDVYDKTSSPDLSDSSPPRKTKSKRKRPTRLKEISGNIPKIDARSGSFKSAKSRSRSKLPVSHTHENSHDAASFLSYGQDNHVLSDGGDNLSSGGWVHEPAIRSAHTLGSFPYATYSTPTPGEPRASVRERHPIHSLNPFSLSRESPTANTKNGSRQMFATTGTSRAAGRIQVFHDSLPAGAFSHPHTLFSANPTSRYQESPRMPMMDNQHLGAQHQSPYSNQADGQHRMKQEDFTLAEGAFHNPASHDFLSLSAQNPLFSQDRDFGISGNPTMPNAQMTSLGFLPINRNRDKSKLGSSGDGHDASDSGQVKSEEEMGHLEGGDSQSGRRSYLGKPLWHSRDPDDSMDVPSGLDASDLGI